MQCFYDTKKKTSGDHLLFAKKTAGGQWSSEVFLLTGILQRWKKNQRTLSFLKGSVILKLVS